MPLEKKVVSVSFNAGVDSKTDPKQIVAGKLSVLENAVWTKLQQIQKRNGFAQFTTSVLSGSWPTGGMTSLAPLQDGALFAVPAQGGWPYQWNPSSSQWLPRSTRSTQQSSAPCGASTLSVSVDRAGNDPSYSMQSPDLAVSGTTQAIVSELGNLLSVVVTDLSTGGSGGMFTLGGGTMPKVIVLGSSFVVFFVETSTNILKFWRASAASAAAWGGWGAGTTTVATLASGATNYDVSVINGTAYVAYNSTTANTIGVRTVSPSFVVSSETAFTGPAACLSVFKDSTATNNVCVAWSSGTAVSIRVLSSDLGTVLKSTTTVETLSSVVRITGAPESASAFRVFYSVSATDTSNWLTRSCQVISYAPQTPYELLRSVSLVSKPWLYGGKLYVCLGYAHASNMQNTLFVVDSLSAIVARALAGRSPGCAPRTTLSEAVMVAQDTAQIAVCERQATITDLGTPMFGVSCLTVDHAPSPPPSAVELGNNLHVNGGYLWMSDGANVWEHGFHLFPQAPSTDNPGGTNVYQYVCCYEWVDTQGQTHRSCPSPAFTTARVTALGGTVGATVSAPCLRVTEAIRPVRIQLYRTIANGTIFYKCGGPSPNATNLDSYSVLDQTYDSDLLGSEQLYTTGGVIENIAPNAASAMWSGQNRIFLVDAEVPGQIWFSKQVLPRTPVEFSDLQILNTSLVGGPVKCGVEMDGKQILFRRARISYFYGDGPDSTGGGTQFSTEQNIPSDVGCSSPKALVLTPNGVIFKSAKGFYLLDRSLGLSYIGMDVEEDNAQSVTSAVMLEDRSEARFTLGNGTILVYNFIAQQWARFTNLPVITDACVYQGLYTVAAQVSGVGYVWQETPGTFVDPTNVFIKMRAVTGWLQLAGLQGFQRVYAVQLLGEYKSAHNLLVKLAFARPDDPTSPGFQAGFTQSTTVVSPASPYQYEIGCQKQKCEAIKISIEDVDTGTDGESFSLSSLALEVGLKSGKARLPGTARLG